MINITFTGKIHDSTGNVVTEPVSFKAFFHNMNPSSSDDTWSDKRLSELNDYNINLGDPDLLGQQGSASNGDIILLLFWVPFSSDNSDSNLTEWSLIEYTLDGADTYVQDVQLMNHHNPTCDFSFENNDVGKPSLITDIGSHDDYQWVFSGKTHYQNLIRHGEFLFEMNRLPNDTIDIDWGDTHLSSGLPLSGSPFSHTYNDAGDYTSVISITNKSGLQCQDSFPFHVEYNVINGLQWPTPVIVNQPTTYSPSISGDLVRITTVDYYIDGVLRYPNLLYNESFNHQFTVSDDHIIKQCIKFDDGFGLVEQCHDFIVQMDTQASYVEEKGGCGMLFTDTSVIGKEPVTKYQWDVTDGLFVLSHVEGIGYDEWYYAWPYIGTFQVRLAVTDSNGVSSSITKEFVVDSCPAQDTGGSDAGGGGAPWIYQEYKDLPLPTVKVVSIEECDYKDKIILITDIKEVI